MNRRKLFGLAALGIPAVALASAQEPKAPKWFRAELGDNEGLPYARPVFYTIDLSRVEMWSEEDRAIRLYSGRDVWTTAACFLEFIKAFRCFHNVV